MHTVGLDFGSVNCVFGTVTPNGLGGVISDDGLDKYPAVVGFADCRLFGKAAERVGKRNKISQLKSLVSDTAAQFEVTYNGTKKKFQFVQILGMLFAHCKRLVEKHVGEVECIGIGCPLYFTEDHKAVLLQAAAIAGFRKSRTVNEMDATIRSYFYCKLKTELKWGNIAFVDVGKSALQIVLAYVGEYETRELAKACTCEDRKDRNVVTLMEKVLSESGKNVSDVDWVELIGSGAQDKDINNSLGKFFNKKCRLTLQAKESVAKGCALICQLDRNLLKGGVTQPHFIDDELEMFLLDCKVEREKLEISISKYRNELDQTKAEERKFLKEIGKWQAKPNSNLSPDSLRTKADEFDKSFATLMLKRVISMYKDCVSSLRKLDRLSKTEDQYDTNAVDPMLKDLDLGKLDVKLIRDRTKKLERTVEDLMGLIDKAPTDDKELNSEVAEQPREKTPEKLSLTETVDHEIWIPDDSRPAFGSTRCSNIHIPASYFKTIVPETMLEICSGHRNLLTLIWFISKNDAGYNIVTEEVQRYEKFFMDEWENVLQNYTQQKDVEGLKTLFQMWWDNIESKFQIFFRGVIEAVMYLRDYKLVIDANSLYITSFGHARVLPSGQAPDDKAANHVLVVKDAIYKVLALPFDHTVHSFEVDLPMELHEFLTRQHEKYRIMQSLSDSIILYESYFWTIEERIQFMQRMSFVLKRVDSFRDIWNTAYGKGWVVYVNNNGDDKFKAHLEEWCDRCGLSNSTDALGSDVIRYINAIYSHVNDMGKTAKNDTAKKAINAKAEHKKAIKAAKNDTAKKAINAKAEHKKAIKDKGKKTGTSKKTTTTREVLRLYDVEKQISALIPPVFCNTMQAIYGALSSGDLNVEDHKIEELDDGVFRPGGSLRPCDAKLKSTILIPSGKKGYILKSG